MATERKDTSELLKKVRRIELRTKRKSSQLFSGEYHSAFKGRGMAFAEVREYAPGDEIRIIDWNVTARTGIPHVKVFEEERELTVMMLMDISGSDEFGTGEVSKRERMTEIAAVLAFSAIQNNDKVGIIFFSDHVEGFIPPKKGRSHILHIIRNCLDVQATSKGTNLDEALRYLNNIVKKRSITFILSDFLDEGFTDAMRLANKKHECIALQVLDPKELAIPSMGLVCFQDAETGEQHWVDTDSKKVRRLIDEQNRSVRERLETELKRSGVDHELITTDEDYVAPLMHLFKRR